MRASLMTSFAVTTLSFATLAPAQQLDAKTRHDVRHVLHGCILRLEGSVDIPHITLAGVGTAHSEDGIKPREFYTTPTMVPLTHWLERESVILVADTRTRRDPNGKLVAYAMQPGTSRDWGWSLIRSGYGYARRDYSYDQKAQYILAEQAAKRERIGLWKNTEYLAPPPVVPINNGSTLPTMLAASPSKYSEAYKDSLYRSIKTRRFMRNRSLAARNGRSIRQESRTGSFDTLDGVPGEELAQREQEQNRGQPQNDARPPEEKFEFPEKDKQDGFAEIRRQQAEIEDLKRQLELAKRVIRGEG